MSGDEDGAPVRPGARRRWRLGLVVVPVALLISSAVVYQASSAAFTASTRTGTNAWQAGQVALGSDTDAGAVFTVDRLVPGDSAQRCVTVTYGGTLAADVRLYVTGAAGGLAGYLALTVQEGRTGTPDCTGFVAEATLTSPGETLADFQAAHTAFADGASTWRPGTPGTRRVYRIAWTLQGDNAAQGLTATGRFAWEARSR